MLSRLASWRAPEPEQETAHGEVHPVGGNGGVQSRALPRTRRSHRRVTALTTLHDCRAPPGRLGLAFKDSTRVVARVNATSALFGMSSAKATSLSR